MFSWLKSKKTFRDITPDDVFLDSSNLPGLAVEQFEGRVEQPVSAIAVWMVFVALVLVAGVFLWRIFDLQVSKGAQYALAAENNRLAHSLIFAERGVLIDRTGKELAWNEKSEELPYSLRRYIELPGLSHVLGFVRYPRADNSGVWWRTDLKGTSGAELIFDDILDGENGTEMTEIDAHGNIARHTLIEPPSNGKSVTLSIDAEMQSKLYKILSNHASVYGFDGGAAIILDVRTGEIIALVSIPEFSSQILTDGARDLVERYTNDPRKPFLNRVIGGAYTPGSIVKPFFAAGALQEKIIDPLKSIFSPGFITVPNKYNPDKPTIIKDWRAHGWTAMREALAVSSDVYFFSIGGGYEEQEGLGIARLGVYARSFGLGKETGVDFIGEVPGTVPSPAWKEGVFGKDEPWLLGDTYNTAIGQYGFQVTPIQMARAIAAVANGGALPIPHITASTTPVLIPTGVSDAHLQIVRDGMRLGVTSDTGTARALNIYGFPVAAKTGTAEVGARNQYMNSWVVGFWPYEKPHYAFAVVLERAPSGTLAGASPAMHSFFEWLAERDID